MSSVLPPSDALLSSSVERIYSAIHILSALSLPFMWGLQHMWSPYHVLLPFYPSSLLLSKMKFGVQDFGHPLSARTSRMNALCSSFSLQEISHSPSLILTWTRLPMSTCTVDFRSKIMVPHSLTIGNHCTRTVSSHFHENFFIPSSAGAVVKQVLSIIFNDSLQMLWLKIEGGVRMGEGKRYIAVSPFFFQSFEAKKKQGTYSTFHSILDIGTVVVQFLTTHLVNTTQLVLVVLRQGVSKWVLVKGLRRAW